MVRLLTLAALAATALAKTDYDGCTSTATMITVSGRNDVTSYATTIHYVPDTGEICEMLDCGGGRAPPKTTVPGCGAYKGTETYEPKFLPSSTADADAEETGDAEAEGSEGVTTAAPTRSGAAPEASGEGGEGVGEGEETGDEDSGAAAVGISVGGLVVAAAAWGLL